MESALLGVVLDSSIVITAERRGLPVPSFVDAGDVVPLRKVGVSRKEVPLLKEMAAFV